MRRQLVEIWQANAGGRYIHKRDQHPAAARPATSPASAAASPTTTARTAFTTIKPGPYPWKNHRNAWRPAHIHFSLFGTDFTQRMITQMYFPGDPLFALDPIYQSITDQAARDRLVATYDHDVTPHEWGTGYRWDIVLTGSHRTPLEDEERRMSRAVTLTRRPARPSGRSSATPCRTTATASSCRRPPAARSACTALVTDGAGDPVPDALIEIWQADADGHVVAAGRARCSRDGCTFTGWGRAATDTTGHYSFTTVRPARPSRAAPFFAITVFARGLLNRLFTRAYLPGDDGCWPRTRCSPR